MIVASIFVEVRALKGMPPFAFTMCAAFTPLVILMIAPPCLFSEYPAWVLRLLPRWMVLYFRQNMGDFSGKSKRLIPQGKGLGPLLDELESNLRKQHNAKREHDA